MAFSGHRGENIGQVVDQYCKKIYIAWIGLYPLHRGRSEEAKTTRNILRRVAYLPPEFKLIFGPDLLFRPIHVSVVILQLWSVFMSKASDTTKN